MKELKEIFITSIGVAVPPFTINQEQVIEILRSHYIDRIDSGHMALAKKVFKHPSVKTRHFGVDKVESVLDENPDIRIARFTDWATRLSCEASRIALQKAGLGAGDISALVVNTCTGYVCPGISNYVIEKLGLRHDIPAYDLVGAGCGGAIPNLILCKSLADDNNASAVLSVSVEICSAAFQMDNDISLIVSNAIFGDGASACIISSKPQGLLLLDHCGLQLTEFREDIRFIYKNGQLYNKLSANLPAIAGKAVGKLISMLLDKTGLDIKDIKHWALHAGGENVINSVKAELGLSEQDVQKTRQILSEYGNMSSPSCIFSLERMLSEGIPGGDMGIIIAFGAGMSAYAYLFKKL